MKLLPTRRKSAIEVVADEGAHHIKELSDREIKARLKRIDTDFRHAFAILKRHPDTVTFFGSSAIKADTKYYNLARTLARRVVQELHLTIVSGGGPGIMEAGNRGAKEGHGESIGMAIKLPNEDENRYLTHSADFYYFFSRKMALTFTARAYVYFPGGYGTLDELFEILTLRKTGKIPPLPVILIGSDFWRPLHHFLEKTVYESVGAIHKKDLEDFIITDDLDEALRIISGREVVAPARR
jgi:uncharacterized protein (TIGR00730 family)